MLSAQSEIMCTRPDTTTSTRRQSKHMRNLRVDSRHFFQRTIIGPYQNVDTEDFDSYSKFLNNYYLLAYNTHINAIE